MLPSVLSLVMIVSSTEMPHNSSASCISTGTYDAEEAKAEGRLTGKQAAVAGGGIGESGQGLCIKEYNHSFSVNFFVATHAPSIFFAIMTFLTRYSILCFSLFVLTEGAAAKATPNVGSEKGERSEKSSSNIDAIGERCDVDMGVHQSEVSSDKGGVERVLSEHKGALKRGCILRGCVEARAR